MNTTQQLALLQQLGHLLLAPQPIALRLRAALEHLRRAVPFSAARVIVLPHASGQIRADAWCIELPAGTADLHGGWPRDLTVQVLQQRRRVQASTAQGGYLGGPIVWQQQVFGAIEIRAHAAEITALAPILEAITPFVATALHEHSGTALAQAQPIFAPLDIQRLQAINTRLQAPLLLQPLLDFVLHAAVAHTGAAHGSIHLAEANGHGLHLLSYELPSSQNNAAAMLAPSSRAHDLAKIALANGRPMIRELNGDTHFATPVLHEDRLLGALTLEGSALDPQKLAWVQQLATIAGPAVIRAQFYQQLADARMHLQQVFDELPTGLALTDGTGTLLRANPAWWRLWGIAPEVIDQVKLVPWDILPHMLHRLPDPLAFSELFTSATTEAKTATIAFQQPWQELRLLFMPVRDTLALQSGFLLAIDDITKERESDRLKTEFVSVVSHELRTPLTSILGYTELLLARDFEPNERKEFIQTVYKQADHLSHLVEDLLKVSRLDTGKITLDRWVMALPKLVRELIAQLLKELDDDQHRLLLDVPDSLPPIFADRDKVHQILRNLLTNAIKYSPEGGEVVLHAAVLRQPTGNARLLPPTTYSVAPPASAPPLPPEPAMLISVRDQGMGIPPHELPRIFERFYRVDNSNTRRIGGTGLGLAITRALVELHGGRIWAESTPGEGSTFYVTLPLATEMLHTRNKRSIHEGHEGPRRK